MMVKSHNPINVPTFNGEEIRKEKQNYFAQTNLCAFRCIIKGFMA